MAWYIETAGADGRWRPEKHTEEPNVDKRGRLQRSTGVGPRVRPGSKKVILDAHASASLDDLQHFYGAVQS